MRTHVVELGEEDIEAALLCSHVRLGRFGRMFLERPVHPLVDAILLGSARLNADLLNA